MFATLPPTLPYPAVIRQGDIVNGKAEIIAKIEELKKVFLELEILADTHGHEDAAEDIFNVMGLDSYPFTECFEDVSARVAFWEIK